MAGEDVCLAEGVGGLVKGGVGGEGGLGLVAVCVDGGELLGGGDEGGNGGGERGGP